MTEDVTALVQKIDDLISTLNTMNQPNESDLEIQRNELRTQVDIYELQARLKILQGE